MKNELNCTKRNNETPTESNQNDGSILRNGELECEAGTGWNQRLNEEEVGGEEEREREIREEREEEEREEKEDEGEKEGVRRR
jgi:hypothetical protein